jgi:glycosyltransferase involved in cell wall biosynthesis
MRVALVHSFYRSDAPSGENVVVLRQAEALKSAGHEVLMVARHTDVEIKSRLYGPKSAIRVATGVGPDPTRELNAFQPDVVHVHNLFPNFGERWLDSWNGPLVATLHNFRPICANGLLYRNGKVCTLCPDGDRWASLKHGCYRDSRVATMPLAIHNAGGIGRNRLLSRADRIIVLSERGRTAYMEAGDPGITAKMVVIPNGIEDRSVSGRVTPRHWAFVGRLSSEKGIKEVIACWPRSERLRVVGGGPLEAELRSMNKVGVTFEGQLRPDQVDEVLRCSWGLVFPSRWKEGFPTVIAEASMHGIPVLARAGSSGADFVEHTASGLVYHSELDLPTSLVAVRDRYDDMSGASRRAYLTNLSLVTWLRRLEQMYTSIVTGRG